MVMWLSPKAKRHSMYGFKLGYLVPTNCDVPLANRLSDIPSHRLNLGYLSVH